MTNNNNNNKQEKKPIEQQEEEEEEIVINEDDEFLGIYHLSKEQLIDTIRDIREEYFELEEDYGKLEDRYKDKLKEIEFNRRLLTEREDLLLQLQWDPNQDTSYFQQMGASDSNQANELKMKSLMDQMRVMERGIFERDEKIKQMEKVIETFTLQQISNGVQPTQIIYPQFNTIRQQQLISSASEPNSVASTPIKPTLFNKLSQSSSNLNSGTNDLSADSPNTFNPISKYPLPKIENDGASSSSSSSTVNVSTPQNNNNNQLNRSTSFWQSPSAFFSNLLGRSSSGNDIQKENNDDKHVEDSDSEEENYDELDTKPYVVPVVTSHDMSSTGIKV